MRPPTMVIPSGRRSSGADTRAERERHGTEKRGHGGHQMDGNAKTSL